MTGAALLALALGATLEIGVELGRVLNVALNIAQIILLAWLAHRYEQNGRERRRDDRR